MDVDFAMIDRRIVLRDYLYSYRHPHQWPRLESLVFRNSLSNQSTSVGSDHSLTVAQSWRSPGASAETARNDVHTAGEHQSSNKRILDAQTISRDAAYGPSDISLTTHVDSKPQAERGEHDRADPVEAEISPASCPDLVSPRETTPSARSSLDSGGSPAGDGTTVIMDATLTTGSDALLAAANTPPHDPQEPSGTRSAGSEWFSVDGAQATTEKTAYYGADKEVSDDEALQSGGMTGELWIDTTQLKEWVGEYLHNGMTSASFNSGWIRQLAPTA